MSEFKILSESESKKIPERKYDSSAPLFGQKMKNYPNVNQEFEKESLKKRKRPNENSTGLFNEKKNKIYDEHDDQSYGKKKIIDSINDDCLLEIFTYLPACERPKLALVCKKWKRILDYGWIDVKKLEFIHWQSESSPLWSLTVRQQFRLFKLLLGKCGRYLTQLDLTAYWHSDIVPVINEFCPNVVNLRFRLTYIDDDMLLNAFTRLSKLKVLTIIFVMFEEPMIPANLINSLRSVANTLTHLSLINLMLSFCRKNVLKFPSEIHDVIPELRALEKFEVAGIDNSEEVRHHNKHNAPYYSDDVLSRCNYRLDHTKKLNLSGWQVTDNDLYGIVNVMVELKILCVSCELVTDKGITAILKMKQLQTLKFIGCNNFISDSSIKSLQNLRRVKLPCSTKITYDSIKKVFENSPRMEKFWFRHCKCHSTSSNKPL